MSNQHLNNNKAYNIYDEFNQFDNQPTSMGSLNQYQSGYRQAVKKLKNDFSEIFNPSLATGSKRNITK